jgi:hypothetical protein
MANNFKVIKLDRRHKKYKYGYRHAIRFDNGFCREAMECERILQNMYPDDTYSAYSANPNEWTYSWGAIKHRTPRYYYLNTKSESDITCVLLSLNVDALY